jgi:hypothetical protein
MTLRKKRHERPIIAFFVLVIMANHPLGAGVGIKGGMSLSGLLSATGDYRHFLGYEMGGLSHGGVLTGFQGGFFAGFDLSPRLQIQPEILYAVRGVDGSQTYLYDEIIFRAKIHYLEFPLLLKYRILAREAFSPVVVVGPYAALKLKTEKETRIWKVKEAGELANVKDVDFGLLFGLGMEHHFGPGRALFELRFGIGLHSVMNALPGTVSLYGDRDHIRNVHLSVMIGYAL